MGTLDESKYFNKEEMQLAVDEFSEKVVGKSGRKSEFYTFFNEVFLLYEKIKRLNKYYKEVLGEHNEHDAIEELSDAKSEISVALIEDLYMKRMDEIISKRSQYFKMYKRINEEGRNEGLTNEKLVPDNIRNRVNAGTYIADSAKLCKEINKQLDNAIEYKTKGGLTWLSNVGIKLGLSQLVELDKKNLPHMLETSRDYAMLPAPAKIIEEDKKFVINKAEKPEEDREKVLYTAKQHGKKINLNYMKEKLKQKVKEYYEKHPNAKKQIKRALLLTVTMFLALSIATSAVENLSNRYGRGNAIVQQEGTKLSDIVENMTEEEIALMADELRTVGVTGSKDDKEIVSDFLNVYERAYTTGEMADEVKYTMKNLMDLRMRKVMAGTINRTTTYIPSLVSPDDIRCEYRGTDERNSYNSIYYKKNGKEELLGTNHLGRQYGGRELPNQLLNYMCDYAFLDNFTEDGGKNARDALDSYLNLDVKDYEFISGGHIIPSEDINNTQRMLYKCGNNKYEVKEIQDAISYRNHLEHVCESGKPLNDSKEFLEKHGIYNPYIKYVLEPKSQQRGGMEI